MTRTRIAALASGGGTNLQAILDHFDQLGDRRRGDVVVVASDRQAAGALARAQSRGIAAASIAASGGELENLLEAHGVELVVLAGYLRRVPETVVHRYAGRMINVHPALLPAFGGPGMYGARVHDAVLAAGVTVSGVTAHFVDEEIGGRSSRSGRCRCSPATTGRRSRRVSCALSIFSIHGS